MPSNLFSLPQAEITSTQDGAPVDSGRFSTGLLLQIACIFWLVAKIIGWKVWVTERLFPLAPLFDFLTVPSLVHRILFIASAILLIALAAVPGSKTLQVALLVTELSSCILDQNRWQPWEYQYIFILITFIANKKKSENIMGCIGLIMASTYFYSGIGKLNPGFLQVVWDNMFLNHFLQVTPAIAHRSIVYYSGYFIGIAEMIGGIGLLLPNRQKLSAISLIIMHFCILIFIGPAGIKYNISIWPWNILMMLHLWLIFINDGYTEINLRVLWNGRNKLTLICWGILPLLNYACWWDNYLSSKLYSGDLPSAFFYVKDSTEKKLLTPYLDKNSKENNRDSVLKVNFQSWAMNEMNIPPYPELRVYRKIKINWLKQHPGSQTKAAFFITVKRKQVKVEE